MHDVDHAVADATQWDRLLSPLTPPDASIQSDQIAGKRVLITGAAGSIGSALAHAAHGSSPGRLILLDTSENGLYELDRSLRACGSKSHVALAGSVCEAVTLEHLFTLYRPQIVLHAAAFKHVPLMEQNPFAAVSVNALGTQMLAGTATHFDCEALVLVSTDKAVDPVSIMGASKRIAELVLLALADGCGTRMLAVRLGNVAGSQGSVLPLFLEQLATGAPLTVTHSDAHRFFITMTDAVLSIFAALAYPAPAAVLVPNLGAPVRILDLAKHLLRTHGGTAGITMTGLRPGDKMAESLLSTDERWSDAPAFGATRLRAIVSPTPAATDVLTALRELHAATGQHDLARMLRIVTSLVPAYSPSSVIRAALQQGPASCRPAEKALA